MPPSCVTAICIDTLHHRMALLACKAMLDAGFRQVVFVTDATGLDHARALGPHDARLRVHVIAPLAGIADYSRLVLAQLIDHFDTEFALIFQWDGLVLRPDAWRDAFLDYDYIGSPWPASLFAGVTRRVGNGGFSLRSRRLVQAAADLNLAADGRNEDAVLCLHYGDQLETHYGIRFAPLDIAREFSIEHATLPWHAGDDSAAPSVRPYGLHGWFNFHLLCSDDLLEQLVVGKMDERERTALLTSWPTTGLLINLHRQGRRDAVLRLSRVIAPLIELPRDHGMTPSAFIRHHFRHVMQGELMADAIEDDAPAPV